MAPYIFDLERSANGLRLNRFLHSLISPAVRRRFAADPEQAMRDAGLDDEERRMLRERDWRALMDHGASFFCLEKLARVTGVSNPEMVAGFRGETLEQFLQTRRVPGAR
jgi:gallate dioxygenase